MYRLMLLLRTLYLTKCLTLGISRLRFRGYLTKKQHSESGVRVRVALLCMIAVPPTRARKSLHQGSARYAKLSVIQPVENPAGKRNKHFIRPL